METREVNILLFRDIGPNNFKLFKWLWLSKEIWTAEGVVSSLSVEYEYQESGEKVFKSLSVSHHSHRAVADLSYLADKCTEEWFACFLCKHRGSSKQTVIVMKSVCLMQVGIHT